MSSSDSEVKLKRDLGIKDCLSLVVGTVIGTGVFLKAAVMTQEAHGLFWVLLAWIVAGVLSLVGAFCFAELGSRYPAAGGEYVYLREAFGGLWGFLNGWMRFWIGNPGSIAAYAVGMMTFLNGVIPFPSLMIRTGCAVLVIVIFTLVNCATVRASGFLQASMAFIKILLIVALTLILCFAGSNMMHARGGGVSVPWPGWRGFASAVMAALWAYDGWNGLPMIAGEIYEPKKTLPRALIGGMLVVTLIYLITNWAYFSVLSIPEIMQSNSPLYPQNLPVAANAFARVVGPGSVVVVSCILGFSALVSLNGSILTGARIPYAMAHDGLFFDRLKAVSSRTHTPVHAVLAQGTLAALLACSGSFDELTDYVMFASWIFYALAAAAIFVLRARSKMYHGFKVPGFPFWPALFFFVSCCLVVNAVWDSPRNCLIGAVFMASGVPVYYLFLRRKSSTIV